MSSPSHQGPQPQQGDPAAPGPPCRPAAPHLQLPEDSPDREGPAASAGGGRRLEPPAPGPARPQRETREEGSTRAPTPPPRAAPDLRETRSALCEPEHIQEKTKQKEQHKKKTPQPWVIPFHLGVRVEHICVTYSL